MELNFPYPSLTRIFKDTCKTYLICLPVTEERCQMIEDKIILLFLNNAPYPDGARNLAVFLDWKISHKFILFIFVFCNTRICRSIFWAIFLSEMYGAPNVFLSFRVVICIWPKQEWLSTKFCTDQENSRHTFKRVPLTKNRWRALFVARKNHWPRLVCGLLLSPAISTISCRFQCALLWGAKCILTIWSGYLYITKTRLVIYK